MHSEWMKVMLAEIERKRQEERVGREEQQRRAAERGQAVAPQAPDEPARQSRGRR